ncbi:MAG TPA: iron-dependent repressor [Bacteroidetes bacterium]|nr:iron-dependent repressor [Bacteroidota bacterium]
MKNISEENYLKAIFILSGKNDQEVFTNDLALYLSNKAASVTDMLKKLAQKKFVSYKKYSGVTLTEQGKKKAIDIVRKHRLWEFFLVNQLGFTWDEIHEVAEQLEHIQSDLLIERLDAYLRFPQSDPHGDPIPNRNGKFKQTNSKALAELAERSNAIVFTVTDKPDLLRYLSKIGIALGTKVKVLEKIPFDNSLLLQLNGKNKIQVSADIAKHIKVQL